MRKERVSLAQERHEINYKAKNKLRDFENSQDNTE